VCSSDLSLAVVARMTVVKDGAAMLCVLCQRNHARSITLAPASALNALKPIN
jgi:hypothetical protein